MDAVLHQLMAAMAASGAAVPVGKQLFCLVWQLKTQFPFCFVVIYQWLAVMLHIAQLFYCTAQKNLAKWQVRADNETCIRTWHAMCAFWCCLLHPPSFRWNLAQSEWIAPFFFRFATGFLPLAQRSPFTWLPVPDCGKNEPFSPRFRFCHFLCVTMV